MSSLESNAPEIQYESEPLFERAIAFLSDQPEVEPGFIELPSKMPSPVYKKILEAIVIHDSGRPSGNFLVEVDGIAVKTNQAAEEGKKHLKALVLHIFEHNDVWAEQGYDLNKIKAFFKEAELMFAIRQQVEITLAKKD